MKTNSINIQNFQIDLEILPDNLKQEIIDFYNFIVSKHKIQKNVKKKKDKDSIEAFIEHTREVRVPMPKDYKFDREWANER